MPYQVKLPASLVRHFTVSGAMIYPRPRFEDLRGMISIGAMEILGDDASVLLI